MLQPNSIENLFHFFSQLLFSHECTFMYEFWKLAKILKSKQETNRFSHVYKTFAETSGCWTRTSEVKEGQVNGHKDWRCRLTFHRKLTVILEIQKKIMSLYFPSVPRFSLHFNPQGTSFFNHEPKCIRVTQFQHIKHQLFFSELHFLRFIN